MRPRLLTIDGVSLSIAEWARRRGKSRQLIHVRLLSGWSERDAVMSPVMSRSECGRSPGRRVTV